MGPVGIVQDHQPGPGHAPYQVPTVLTDHCIRTPLERRGLSCPQKDIPGWVSTTNNAGIPGALDRPCATACTLLGIPAPTRGRSAGGGLIPLTLAAVAHFFHALLSASQQQTAHIAGSPGDDATNIAYGKTHYHRHNRDHHELWGSYPWEDVAAASRGGWSTPPSTSARMSSWLRLSNSRQIS